MKLGRIIMVGLGICSAMEMQAVFLDSASSHITIYGLQHTTIGDTSSELRRSASTFALSVRSIHALESTDITPQEGGVAVMHKEFYIDMHYNNKALGIIAARSVRCPIHEGTHEIHISPKVNISRAANGNKTITLSVGVEQKTFLASCLAAIAAYIDERTS